MRATDQGGCQVSDGEARLHAYFEEVVEPPTGREPRRAGRLPFALQRGF